MTITRSSEDFTEGWSVGFCRGFADAIREIAADPERTMESWLELAREADNDIEGFSPLMPLLRLDAGSAHDVDEAWLLDHPGIVDPKPEADT